MTFFFAKQTERHGHKSELTRHTTLLTGTSTKLRMARRVLALVLLATMANGSFYPEGHFDRVHKVTDYGLFLDYIDQQIEADKTVFTRFIASEG